jgi:hypothetical protein
MLLDSLTQKVAVWYTKLVNVSNKLARYNLANRLRLGAIEVGRVYPTECTG